MVFVKNRRRSGVARERSPEGSAEGLALMNMEEYNTRASGNQSKKSTKNKYRIVYMDANGHLQIAKYPSKNGDSWSGWYSKTERTAKKHQLQAAHIYKDCLVAIQDIATKQQHGDCLMVSIVRICIPSAT